MPGWTDIFHRFAAGRRLPFRALKAPRPVNGGTRPRFWQRFKLHELNPDEWEDLCDGCGLCCLLKFEEDTTSKITHTNVCCKLLDRSTCRCKHYDCRTEIVPDCVTLRPETIEDVIDWMPSSCAYRLIHEGRPLRSWHHLISGSRETVHEAGISARGRCIPEYEINPDDLESYAVNWEQK